MFRRSSVDASAVPDIIKPADAAAIDQALLHAGASDSKKAPLSLVDDKPDSVICQSLHIKGELEYQKLLRVDGTFQGTLITKGSLIVGPAGRFIGSVAGLREVLVDGGQVDGDFDCDKLTLRCGARFAGNVACNALVLDGTCKLKGKVEVR
eukprot:TRINITY_DN16922_c0_g1_i1.p2 TRINITY_DN16922_c0_g1~~TRINITY_DN16922_c0_g1_i1.p2  ORF type:complete len:151 (+),score=60.32 TRINITY_DN16922_c0_g1_i1:238-690(+)